VIEKCIDPFTSKKFPALDMAHAADFRPSESGFSQVSAQFLDEPAHAVRVPCKRFGGWIDRRSENRHVTYLSVVGKL
jgi:hypothetical protein